MERERQSGRLCAPYKRRHAGKSGVRRTHVNAHDKRMKGIDRDGEQLWRDNKKNREAAKQQEGGREANGDTERKTVTKSAIASISILYWLTCLIAFLRGNDMTVNVGS